MKKNYMKLILVKKNKYILKRGDFIIFFFIKLNNLSKINFD